MARAGFSTSVLSEMAINEGFPAASLRSRQQERSRNGPLEDHLIWLKLIIINSYNDNNGPSHCKLTQRGNHASQITNVPPLPSVLLGTGFLSLSPRLEFTGANRMGHFH